MFFTTRVGEYRILAASFLLRTGCCVYYCFIIFGLLLFSPGFSAPYVLQDSLYTRSIAQKLMPFQHIAFSFSEYQSSDAVRLQKTPQGKRGVASWHACKDYLLKQSHKWPILRRFPKLSIVLGIIVISPLDDMAYVALGSYAAYYLAHKASSAVQSKSEVDEIYLLGSSSA